MLDTYRLKNLLNLFGVDESANKKKIDRLYKQVNAKYLSGVIDYPEFALLDSAYYELCEYFDEQERIKEEEKADRKKIFEYETWKVNEEIRKQRELEEHMGPIWTFFEKLKIAELDCSFDDLIEYVKNSVLDNLNEDNKEKYNMFLDLFLKLWIKVYEHILVVESNVLKREDYDSKTAVSFGEDELTDEYFRRNRYFSPYGKFSKLLSLSKELSSLIPDVDANYFLDTHLSLMAEYFNFGYGVSYYRKTPIYTFLANDRLSQFKRDFYDMFDEEVRSGVRKSPIVNRMEMVEFIKNKLNEVNKNKTYRLSEKKVKEANS